MHVVRTGLVRRAPADLRAADDQRRLGCLRLGLGDGGGNGRGIVAVDRADDMPAIGAEAGRGIVAEPAFDMAVDGDPVVVVEAGQLVEAPDASQRAGFVADAFHQAAVAEEDPGAVIDDGAARPVEALGQQLFGQRHADGVGEALAERPGGRLDAGRVADFRVAGGAAAELAEVLQVVEAQVVAGQMQQRVEQHRAVAVGQHEAVAVRPFRVGRVVLQVVSPQHFGDVGHAHWGAGVAGLGLVDGVNGQEADGVGQFTAEGGFGRVAIHVSLQNIQNLTAEARRPREQSLSSDFLRASASLRFMSIFLPFRRDACGPSGAGPSA
jgi:hypothetical protein